MATELAPDSGAASQANFDLRQLSDMYEATTKVQLAAEGRLRARLQGADDTTVKKEIASDAVVRSLEAVRREMYGQIYPVASSHPCYTWGMGIPGINLMLLCKLLGGIRMDGPDCVRCGEEQIPALHNAVVCWRCFNVVDAAKYKAGDKCKNRIPNPAKPGKFMKCDRTLTLSSYVLCCSACGGLQHDFPTFSGLRTFTGHAPGRNKRVIGQHSPFSGKLRVQCFQAFACMLKAGGIAKAPPKPGKTKTPNPLNPPRFFLDIYENWRITYAERHGVGPQGKLWLERREIYNERRFTAFKSMIEIEDKTTKRKRRVPEWPDLRQHLASKNKLMDVFLFHLWFTWRDRMGWPTQRPYAIERLGHQTMYHVEDFSSAGLAEKKDRAARPRPGTNLPMEEELPRIDDDDLSDDISGLLNGDDE